MTTERAASEYFTVGTGAVRHARWRRFWRLLRLLDAAADVRAAPALWRARRAARRLPAQNVLLAAIRVAGREADLDRVVARIAGDTRHAVSLAVTPMAPVGKFDNINRAIATHDMDRHDWLLVIDDDIDVPDGFLDLLLYFAQLHGLKLAQPAHRFRSFSTFAVTERHWAALCRQTRFVEIGPVSLLHRDTFADLLPFPSLRWAWGLDIFWADVAAQRGWHMGVVDAVPIRHKRPVAASYDVTAARDEAVAFLSARGVTISPAEMFGADRRIA